MQFLPTNPNRTYDRIVLTVLLLWVMLIGIGYFVYVMEFPKPEENAGLVRTPLMGWTSRKHLVLKKFGEEEEEDLDEFPTREKAIESAAAILNSDGYSKAGYNYVIIDEAWSAARRDKQGLLEADSKRFPHGIRHLAKHMHKLNLKLGISADIGTETCSGHPGSWASFDQDAKTFSEWEIDLLTVSGCFANETMLQHGYSHFRQALNRTKRPIVYSIDWPLHDRNVNFSEVAAVSHLWRVCHEVHDSFESVLSVVDFVAAHPNIFRKFSGPGSWANLDVLAVGGSHLSLNQSKLQMAMWSIFPAPLILHKNLKNIKEQFKEVLIDKDVIAVNQDSLGLPGKKVLHQDNLEVWIRKIGPIDGKEISKNTSYSFALVVLNRELYGKPTEFKFTPESFGMKHENGYEMKELFHKFTNDKHVRPNSTITVSVDASSAVFLNFKLNATHDHQQKKHPFYFVDLDSYFSYN